jgi:predicted transcriptional regulator
MTKKNESWFLSKDLVDQLNISRTAIIRGLTKLSEQGLLLRKPLKLRGFAYKINSKKTFN